MMAIEHVAKKVGEFKETMAKVLANEISLSNKFQVAQMMKEKREAEAAEGSEE